MALVVSQPPAELVEWACKYQRPLHVRWPADRPWYIAPAPPGPCQTWEYECRCRRTQVRVTGYDGDVADVMIYIGQCSRCQAVIWAVRGGPALPPS